MVRGKNSSRSRKSQGILLDFSLMKKENLLKTYPCYSMSRKRGYKFMLETTAIYDIFCRGNATFIRKKSWNFDKGCLWQPSRLFIG